MPRDSKCTKTTVSVLAGVGIIYRASDPRQIFLEQKGDTYPSERFRRTLCFIGGNWRGEEARKDRSTRDTFIRELGEELTFERPLQNTSEMLGHHQALAVSHFRSAPCTREPTRAERQMLEEIKTQISILASPISDYLIVVGPEVEHTPAGHSGVCSYFDVPLGESAWCQLLSLQRDLGNLSSESSSIITSLEELVFGSVRVGFGHAEPLRDFWIEKGFREAEEVPIFPGITARRIGTPLSSYDEYLERYIVTNQP